MALTKRLYINHKTVITAENLNDIQDAIIALEQVVGIVPGEGEATRTICVINPNGNYTLAETVALPDGLYWLVNPIIFTNADATETFRLTGLAAKTGSVWVVYDTGSCCTVDDAGVLQSWFYIGLPAVSEESDGMVLAVSGGRWGPADPQTIFPDGDEVAYG